MAQAMSRSNTTAPSRRCRTSSRPEANICAKGISPTRIFVGIGGGIGLAEVLIERLQRCCRLRAGDTGANAPDDGVTAGALSLGIAVHRNGQVEVRTAPQEALRHNADDGARAMLDIDDGAEHRWLSAEVALPVAIADERDIPVAGLDIDIGGGAAKDGLDAEDGKGICADVVAA